MLGANQRGNIPRVIVVITDGRSDDPAATTEAALNAKNEGITVFAIGEYLSPFDCDDDDEDDDDDDDNVEEEEKGVCDEGGGNSEDDGGDKDDDGDNDEVEEKGDGDEDGCDSEDDGDDEDDNDDDLALHVELNILFYCCDSFCFFFHAVSTVMYRRL